MNLKPYSWLAYDVEPEPLDFVLPGLLAGSVGALVSPGGQGKSWLALELLMQVALGVDLLGIGDFPTGRVAYFPAEDPVPVLDHRTHALKAHISREQYQTLCKEMAIFPLQGSGPDIADDRWHSAVVEAANGCRLVVLDTISRFHRSDENSPSEMAKVISCLESIAKKTGAAIIFLHHTQKSAALNGDGNKQQASRGASSLTDNIRWQAYLVGCSESEATNLLMNPEERGYYVKFGLSKVNYGPPISELWLRRQKNGLLKSCEIESSPKSSSLAKRGRKSTSGFDRALQASADDYRRATRGC